ncbi:MAG: dihydroorotate dehydrogenase-like protein [Cyclobacteriaceae bacterium]|nr:dihydroorotate dehydrogenase-like protein [Cyclobacteriaceae bacterium]
MDLSTKYLGFNLKSPLVVSASPLSDDIDNIKRMEEHGASAIVLYSLFEEQINAEEAELHYHTTEGTDSFAEALSYFPEADEYHLGPHAYLNHITAAKKAVDIPIIASLNGYSEGGWLEYAKLIEQAGADALELNIYYIATDPMREGTEVEKVYVDIVTAVKKQVSIPVAVKLSPFFSNMANMAKKLDDAGADALVLFNRYYQPDIDLNKLEVIPNVLLSRSYSLRLPMRWIAILHSHLQCDLASTSGIHTGQDVIKMMMVGANVSMLNSVLLRQGIPMLGVIEKQVRDWMEENEYESIDQMRGSMSQKNVEDPSAYERAQYMKAITYYKIENHH